MSRPDARHVTIYAPATPPGAAAVAVLRLSGPESRAILSSLTGRNDFVPRRASLVTIRDPASGETLDRALAVLFPGPESYTGEDSVELHLHGGRAVMADVLDCLASLASLASLAGEGRALRPAEPGEFTRRAFLAGKMDLTEAEGIADLVAAETSAQRRQALGQAGGALGRLYESWRSRLIRILAHAEAMIDFPEEDLPERITDEAIPKIQEVMAEITQHLADARRGEILRDGVHVVILGPPNAGKSTLLNKLAAREAAIVAARAGTTRDVIEVRLDVAGVPVILADTAGLRETGDEIESEGVRRAVARAAEADLRLVVVDATEPGAGAAAIERWGGEDPMVLVNKIDLLATTAPVPETLGGHRCLALSLGTGAGLGPALAALAGRVRSLAGDGRDTVLTRARHRTALEEVRQGLARAADRLGAGGGLDLAAEDLRLAARSLGRFTGRVDVDELLDVVFGEFCIGK